MGSSFALFLFWMNCCRFGLWRTLIMIHHLTTSSLPHLLNSGPLTALQHTGGIHSWVLCTATGEFIVVLPSLLVISTLVIVILYSPFVLMLSFLAFSCNVFQWPHDQISWWAVQLFSWTHFFLLPFYQTCACYLDMLLWKVFHQYLQLLQNFQWPCIIEVGYTCQGLVEMEEMVAENKEFKNYCKFIQTPWRAMEHNFYARYTYSQRALGKLQIPPTIQMSHSHSGVNFGILSLKVAHWTLVHLSACHFNWCKKNQKSLAARRTVKGL